MEAVEYAKQGLSLFEELHGDIKDVASADLFCQYGFLQTLRGGKEEARDAFDWALKLPTCSEYVCTECYEAHYGLGIYHACNGDMRKAREEFDKSLQIKPANILCRNLCKKIF